MSYKFSPKAIHCLNHNLVCYAIESENDSEKVGIMDLVFEKNGDDIYLDYIEVKENLRGCGIGTQILKKLIEFCKNFGSKRIYFMVDFDNDAAMKLYLKLGFSFTGNITPLYCYEMELML